jgi:hypothetical protein
MPDSAVVLECREIDPRFIPLLSALDAVLPTDGEILGVGAPGLFEGTRLILVQEVHQDPKVLGLNFVHFVQVIRSLQTFDSDLLIQVLQLSRQVKLSQVERWFSARAYHFTFDISGGVEEIEHLLSQGGLLEIGRRLPLDEITRSIVR